MCLNLGRETRYSPFWATNYHFVSVFLGFFRAILVLATYRAPWQEIAYSFSRSPCLNLNAIFFDTEKSRNSLSNSTTSFIHKHHQSNDSRFPIGRSSVVRWQVHRWKKNRRKVGRMIHESRSTCRIRRICGVNVVYEVAAALRRAAAISNGNYKETMLVAWPLAVFTAHARLLRRMRTRGHRATAAARSVFKLTDRSTVFTSHIMQMPWKHVKVFCKTNYADATSAPWLAQVNCEFLCRPVITLDPPCHRSLLRTPSVPLLPLGSDQTETKSNRNREERKR